MTGNTIGASPEERELIGGMVLDFRACGCAGCIKKAEALESLISDRAKLRERVSDLELVTDLALDRLGELEPGDSRAVSDEFVAMAAIRCEQDSLDECRQIIRAALNTTKESGNG